MRVGEEGGLEKGSALGDYGEESTCLKNAGRCVCLSVEDRGAHGITAGAKGR